MIYDRMEDVPAPLIEAIHEGTTVLVRCLRRWRQESELHSISAEWLTADGTVAFHCDHNDRVTMRIGGTTLEINR